MTEDSELLSRYATERSEGAFAELTERHVDLVYSAALRLVNGDVSSAQDVTQQVFTEAARQAKGLAQHPALVGWFYTTTRHMALRANRTEQRRKAREEEANAMNELLQDESPGADWAQLGPVLDEVMHELDEKDRHAILLRFFQNKPLKEVGAALSLNENAARMRVERALDKLRGKLARRGVSTTAAALAAVVGVNAVQAAPVGLAVAVSAAAVAGTAGISTALAATKAITMTTLQKTIIVAALSVAAGTGLYAVRQGSQMRDRIQTLEQKQAPLAEQIRQLEQERDEATNRLAALHEENERLKSPQTSRELMKLRGEVGVLRKANSNQANANAPATGLSKMMSDPTMKAYIEQAQRTKIRELYADFFKEQNLTPEQSEGVLQVMCDRAAKSMEQLTAVASGGQEKAAAFDSEGLKKSIQEVLGDAGYARFEEYSSEMPARTTVKLLNDQSSSSPLTADQRTRLLQVVKAEPYDITAGIMGAPDKAFLGSQADIDNFLQKVGESNQRIVQQASSFLSPDQVATLDGLLSNAVNSRKLQAAALIQKH